jgi:hypothetical protein
VARDLKDFQEVKDLKDLLDHKVQQGLLAPMVPQDLQVLAVHKDH